MVDEDIISEARSLYSSGFNVFPIQWASKDRYGSWSILTTTRIHESFIDELFTSSNIGVMTGRLSDNLFILDCDDEETYERVGSELEKRKISAWIRLGFRGGQYWLRCREGEVANVIVDKLDVLGNRKYTVAPPSVHPEGVFYEWKIRQGILPPAVSITELDFLKLKLATTFINIKRDKTTLPPVAHKVLIDGNASDYTSNSEAEFAACLSLINSKKHDDMIRTIFAEFNPPHYAKSNGRYFDRHTLTPAHEWLAKQDALKSEQTKNSCPHSDQFIQFADSQAWLGRTGNTDKAVYLALCKRMREDRGNQIFRASIREVSEIANIGTQAVQASLKRLALNEFIKYENKDEISGASHYSLFIKEEMSAVTTVGKAYALVRDSVVTNAMAEDAFHVKALGKSSCSIWRLLLTEKRAMTITEISGATGRVYSTIKFNLMKLETVGLVRKSDNSKTQQWIGIETDTDALHEIAKQMRTNGKQARRKVIYMEERQKRVSRMILDQKKRFLLLQKNAK